MKDSRSMKGYVQSTVNRKGLLEFLKTITASQGCNATTAIQIEAVDNSVSAGAKNILIVFEPDESVVVTDDGCGIKKAEKSLKLKDSFCRLAEQQSRENNNKHGIGLKLGNTVYRYIDIHTKAEGEKESFASLLLNKTDDDTMYAESDDDYGFITGSSGTVIKFREPLHDLDRLAGVHQKNIDLMINRFSIRYMEYLNDGLKIKIVNRRGTQQKYTVKPQKFDDPKDVDINFDIDYDNPDTIRADKRKVFKMLHREKGEIDKKYLERDIILPSESHGLKMRINMQFTKLSDIDREEKKSEFNTGVFVGGVLLAGNVFEALERMASIIDHPAKNFRSYISHQLTITESANGFFFFDDDGSSLIKDLLGVNKTTITCSTIASYNRLKFMCDVMARVLQDASMLLTSCHDKFKMASSKCIENSAKAFAEIAKIIMHKAKPTSGGLPSSTAKPSVEGERSSKKMYRHFHCSKCGKTAMIILSKFHAGQVPYCKECKMDMVPDVAKSLYGGLSPYEIILSFENNLDGKYHVHYNSVYDALVIYVNHSNWKTVFSSTKNFDACRQVLEREIQTWGALSLVEHQKQQNPAMWAMKSVPQVVSDTFGQLTFDKGSLHKNITTFKNLLKYDETEVACSKCQHIYKISEMREDNTSATGYSSECKKCSQKHLHEDGLEIEKTVMVKSIVENYKSKE